MKTQKLLRDVVSYVQDRIAQAFGQGGLLGPLRGPSTLAWLIRIGALFWTLFQFTNNWGSYAETVQFLARMILFAFFVYVILSLYGEIYFANVLASSGIKTFRVCFEIVAYTLFYFISGDYQSEFYLLYLLPLILAIRYLDFRRALLSLVLAVISLHFTFAELVPGRWTFDVWQAYIARQSILLGIGLFYALYQYHPVVGDFQRERSTLLSTFRSLDKGIYIVDQQGRLLFVNESLSANHGPYYVGQPSAAYFGCADGLCALPSVTEIPGEGSDALKDYGSFSDQDSHPYEVEIFKSPMRGEANQLLGTVGIVSDLWKEKLAENRLVEYTRLVERHVEALSMERHRILTTITDLGPTLAGTGELKNVVKIVARVASESLNAETAQIFLLENNQLVRKAIHGFSDDWFVEESYPAGVGLTGQVMAVREGSKYGKPIRVQEVENDPRVLPRHLSKYKQKSGFRQIRHLMAVPINGWEKTFGVIRVVNKLDEKGNLSVDGFTKEDEDFLVSIATITALSIENQNANLFQEATRRLQDNKALFTVSQTIIQIQDEIELFQVIVDQARQTIPGAEKAVIHLIDYQQGILVAQAASPNNETNQTEQPFEAGEGIVGWVIRQRTPKYVRDTHKDQDFVARGSSYRSLLVVPLMIRNNNVIGTISVASSLVHAFDSPEDQQLLTALAIQAAIGIEREKFINVVRKINSNLGALENVLPAIFEELRLVGYDSASLQIIHDHRLRITDCDGFPNPGSVKRLSFPIDDPKFPNWKVLQSGQPFIVDDVRLQYPHFVEEASRYQSAEIRSWLGVPLVNSEGKVIGMLALDKYEPNYYRNEHATSALAFANHMAIALANAKLLTEVQEQRDKLKKLYQVSRILSSSLDYEQTLANILSAASKLCRSNYTAIALSDDGMTISNSIEDRTIGKPLHKRMRDDGITRKILLGYRAIFTDNLGRDDEKHNAWIRKEGFQSYAGLPIIVRGKVRGILFVHSYRPGAFTKQKRLLETFCNHAAVALEKTDLYNEAEMRKTMLDKLSIAQSSLIGVSDALNLYRTCTSRAADIFNIEDCSLYVVDNEKGLINLAASNRIPEDFWHRQDIFLTDKGLTPFAIREGALLNLSAAEIEKHPEWSGKFQEHLAFLPSGRCHSLIVVPLKNKQGKNIGALKLENRLGESRGNRFPDFEVYLLQTYASSISLAIEVSKSFQKEVEEEAKLQAYDRLSRELHDINNVLGGPVVVESSNAIKWLEQANYTEVRNKLELISKGGQYVLGELESLRLGLLHPDIDREELMVSLEKYAREILRLRCLAYSQALTPIPGEIKIGLFKIGRAALDNIKRHAGVDEFRLELTEQDGILDFSICDSGVGFDVETKVNQPTSFGLQNMKWLAKKIGGICEIDSHPSKGTTIRVRVSLQEANYV